MKKFVYTIDDTVYFEKEYGITDATLQENRFQAIYTLYGSDSYIDRYELTDFDGNKIPLASLNGYQRGVVLNDCKAHFMNKQYFSGANKPCGVINIDVCK